MAASIGMTLFVFANGAISKYYFTNVTKEYKEIVVSDLPNLIQVQEMRDMLHQIEAIGLQPGVVTATADLKLNSLSEIKRIKSDYEKVRKEFYEVGDESEAAKMKEIDKHYSKLLEGVEKAVEASTSADAEKQKLYFKYLESEFLEVYVHVESALSDLSKFEKESAHIHADKADKEFSQAQIVSFATMGVGSILSLLLGFFVARNLSFTLTGVSKRFTHEYKSHETVSKKINDSGVTISKSTSDLASAITEIAASLDEIAAMARKSTDNASQSAEISSKSQNAASLGQNTVQEVIGAIGEISNSNSEITDYIEKSNQQLSEIAQLITEIGNKTKVINDIVFQTKLLSFNASVEAARAGEHGKGFAVVAEEVGNLAQMSGNASREISEMLENSVRRVNSIVDETRAQVKQLVEHGKLKIEAGTDTAGRCGIVLSEIVEHVTDVSNKVAEIVQASQEQALVTGEIIKAMSQMSTDTNYIATQAKEYAAVGGELQGSSNQMKSTIETLDQVIKGGSTGNLVIESKAPKAKLFDFGRKKLVKKAAEQKKMAEKKAVAKNVIEKKVVATKPIAPPPETKKVIPIAEKKVAKKVVDNKPDTHEKLAAGGDVVPSENDPRFEEF